jgi:hypothetical protein
MGPPPLPHCTALPPPQPRAFNMECDYVAERMSMLPFDFNSPAPPTPAPATPSKPPTPNVAFFGEKRSNHKKQPFQPTKNGYDTVFRDPAFQRDVQDFFDTTSHSKGTQVPGEQATEYYDIADVAPVYKAKDDDLAVWKKRLETGAEVKDSDAQGEAEKEKSAEHVLRDKQYQECLEYGLFDGLSEDASETSGVCGVSG